LAERAPVNDKTSLVISQEVVSLSRHLWPIVPTCALNETAVLVHKLMRKNYRHNTCSVQTEEHGMRFSCTACHCNTVAMRVLVL
jgi:hypothetical protein